MREAKFKAYLKEVKIINKIATSENKDDEQVVRIVFDADNLSDEAFLILKRFPSGQLVTGIVLPHQLELQDVMKLKELQKQYDDLLQRYNMLVGHFKPILRERVVS